MRSLPIFARRAATQVACLGALTGALLACATPALAGPGPGPEITVTPSPLDFGEHAPNTMTAKTVIVENTGDENLTLDGFDGDGFPFAADHDESACESNPVVLPDGTCTIVVLFMPDQSESSDLKSGNLTIWSDAVNAVDVGDPGGPDGTVVPLTATVIDPPEISVSAPALDFGNVQVGQSSAVKTLTVTNTGVAPLTIRESLYMNDDDQFSVVSETCTDEPITAGEQCTIGVRFTPYQGGLIATELEIHSNATNEADAFTKVALTGTGTFNVPAVPTVSSPADGSTTTDSTPDVTVAAEPGVYVHLTVDRNTDLGYQQADANGTATFTLTTPLADGQHELVVFAENYVASAERTSTFTVSTTPVTAPPQPPVNPTNPTNPLDPDADGIHNDWLVNGKPVAAPAKPRLGKVTGKSATVKLPKAPKGSKLAVYVRTGNGKFAKAKGKPNKKGELTIKSLKKNAKYEIKLVKVNQAGKQSAASKTLKVKTKKK